VHQVTFGGGPKYNPTWASYSDTHQISGEGPHDIAYSVDEGGVRYLDVAEVGSNDGPGVVNPFRVPADIRTYPLTGYPGGDTAPNWSPMGRNILFASTAGIANEDIYGLGPMFAVPGTPISLWWQGPATRLTSDPARDTNPDWETSEQCSVMAPRPPLPAPSRSAGGGDGGSGGGGGSSGGGGSGGGGGGATGGGGGGGGGAHVARRRSPGLAIRGARWHGGRVSVVGRAARGLRHRVRVAFACGHHRRQHTQKRVGARSGRFGARLRAPRACLRARRGVVAAAFGGDRRYRKQKVSVRVRRR
jgi:hypothetical protein